MWIDAVPEDLRRNLHGRGTPYRFHLGNPRTPLPDCLVTSVCAAPNTPSRRNTSENTGRSKGKVYKNSTRKTFCMHPDDVNDPKSESITVMTL